MVLHFPEHCKAEAAFVIAVLVAFGGGLDAGTDERRHR
jgi:hypothetical protein